MLSMARPDSQTTPGDSSGSPAGVQSRPPDTVGIPQEELTRAHLSLQNSGMALVEVQVRDSPREEGEGVVGHPWSILEGRARQQGTETKDAAATNGLIRVLGSLPPSEQAIPMI